MSYFSGQGRVFIGTRDLNGNPQGLTFVGNVPDLKVSLSVETLEHQESQSGQRLTDLQLIKTKKGEFACTLEELIQTNLELALYGSTTAQTSGTVTDEPVITTAETGKLYLLGKQNVSSVVIKAGATTVANTKYGVNEKHGSLQFTDLTGVTGAITASYSYGTANVTAMFTQPLPERWVRFEGLNTADSNREVVIDLYRVAINPAKDLSVIGSELMKFELSGQVLADLTKSASGELGQFGRLVLV